MRYTLANVLVAIGVLALGLAALRSSTHYWAAGIFSIALALTLVALIGVSVARGELRAFCSGFVILGGGYLVLALGPWFIGQVSPNLITTVVVKSLQELMPRFHVQVGDAVQVQWGSGWYRCTVLDIRDGQYLIHYEGYSSASDEWVTLNRIKLGDPEHFWRIGHSLFALMAGFIGAAIALRMHSRQARAGSMSVESGATGPLADRSEGTQRR